MTTGHDDEPPWWTCDSDDSDAEEPEVEDFISEEQAAGPPLEVGDKINFVKASVGDPSSRGYRWMCIYAVSHILYE